MKYERMRAAPVIVIAKIDRYQLVSGQRLVERPRDEVNPASVPIPLQLARIRADVLYSLRGGRLGPMQFYSWIWTSGMHGGDRLFRPDPGSVHVLFLRDQGGYLHTVGDYPNYDIPLRKAWAPSIIAELRGSTGAEAGVLERFVTARMRVELEDLKIETADAYKSEDTADLALINSPFWYASELESFCRSLEHPIGRRAACIALGREFEGRCQAFAFAGLEGRYRDCMAAEPQRIEWQRTHGWRAHWLLGGLPDTAENRRNAMRLFASAMDKAFRDAACAAARGTPEARDIPECAA